jgi:asparagine synthase (glutamine-hydrolysing)
LERIPIGLRRALAAAGERVGSDGELTSARNRVRRATAMLPLAPETRYAQAVSRFGLAFRDGLYTPQFSAELDSSPSDVIEWPWRASAATDLIDRMLDVDQQTYLPGDLLVKMDIATMAYGLEARSPLLDHELLEVAAALPSRYKVRGREKKIALREALRGVVPDPLIDRSKQGFQVPMAEWLRTDLRELVSDALLGGDSRARGYLRADTVGGLLQRHLSRDEDNSTLLWSCLMFELWQRQVVESRPSTEAQLVA